MKRTTKISVLAICLAIALFIVPAMALLPDDTESGIFRDGLWALDTTGDHQADDFYILGQTGDIPVAGDGYSGIFRDGVWYLDTTGDNQADTYYIHGQAGDIPVAGDGWIGIYRDGLWAMMELEAPQGVSYQVFGMAGDMPVYRATEDGYQIGIFRPSNGLWAFYLGPGVEPEYFVHGMNGDLPAVGDGYYAIFRDGLWATLDSEAQVDYYVLGMAGDRPVVPFPTAEPTPLEVVSVEAITATTVNATFSAPATAEQAGVTTWNVASVAPLVGFETTATATVAEGDESAVATLALALPASGTYVLDGVEFEYVAPVVPVEVTSVAAVHATQIAVTGTGFTEDNIADLEEMELWDADDSAVTFAVSNAVYVSSTQATMTTAVIANDVTAAWLFGEDSGTFEGDSTAPTVVSVENVNGNTLIVTFDKPVVDAADGANYVLRNTKTGVQNSLENHGAGDDYTPDSMVVSPDQTVVTIVLSGDTTDDFGAGFQTLDDEIYRVFFNTDALAAGSITDVAGNYLPRNTYKQFTGVIGSDTQPAVLLTATYDDGMGELNLGFNKKVKAVAAGDGAKYSIQNGNTVVVLTNVAGALNGAATGLEFTLTSAMKEELGELLPGAKVIIAAGGFKANINDVANAVTVEMELEATIRPAMVGATYDETTHTLTLEFNKEIVSADVDYDTNFKLQSSTTGVTWADVAGTALNTANYVMEEVSARTTVIEFTLDQTAYDLWQAQRADDKVYRVAMADGAVTDGTNANADPSGWQQETLDYVKDTALPAIVSAKFYTTADATADITANTLYIEFDKEIRSGAGYLTNDNKLVLSYDTTEVSMTNAGSAHITAAYLLADVYDEDKKTLNVTFAAGAAVDAIADGDATVAIKAAGTIKDLNKNVAAAQSKAVTYINNVPQGDVTGNAHSTKQVRLTQAATNFGGTISKTNFDAYLATNINDKKAITSAQLIDTNADDVYDSIFITFTTAITAGTDIKVAYTGLVDQFGAPIDNGVTGTIAMIDDVTAPTLVDSEYEDVSGSHSQTQGDKVHLQFTEPVKLITGYGLSAAYGTGATIAVNTAEPNKATITLGSAPAIVFGTTKIQVATPADDFLEDISENEYNGVVDDVPTPEGAVAPELDDEANILFTDVDGNARISEGDTVRIPFDRVLLDDTIVPAKITVTGITGNPFTAAVDGSDVVLTFTEDVAAGEQLPVAATHTISITAAGSGIKSPWEVELDANIVAAAIYLPTTQPRLTDIAYASAANAGDGLIVLSFNQPIYVDTETVDADAFITAMFNNAAAANKLHVTGGTMAGDGAASLVQYDVVDGVTDYTKIVAALDGNQVLDESVTFDASGVTLAQRIGDAGYKNYYSKNIVRNALSYTINEITYTGDADVTPFTVTVAGNQTPVKNGDGVKFTATFNKPVAEGETPEIELTVGEEVGPVVMTVGADRKTWTYDHVMADGFTNTVKATITEAGTDEVGNALTGDFAVVTDTNVVADNTAPALDTPATNSESRDTTGDGKIDEIKLTFTEAIDPATIADGTWTLNDPADDLPITGATTAALTTANMTLTGDGKILTISDIPTTEVFTGVVRVAYAHDGADAITDLAGNKLVAIASGVDSAIKDVAAPVMVSAATADANTVDVTYSEAVAITTPATGRFAAAGTVTPGPHAEGAVPSVAGAVVTLTFTGEFATTVAYPAGTITYTPLAALNAANVKDVAANEAVAQILTGITSDF